MVTLKITMNKMVGEGYTTVGTLKGPSAVPTEDEIGKSPTIEKEETLLPLLRIFEEALSQSF